MTFGIGFLWGLMESLWFFVVPDVVISFLAIKGWKPAVKSTLGAVFGAAMGCIILFALFFNLPAALENLISLWSHLPGYYPKMFQVVNTHLQSDGVRGLLSGPSSGIPYRYYIYEALKLNLPLAGLLAWTPLARLQRIVIAPIVVLILRFLLQRVFRRWFPQKQDYIGRYLVLVIAIYWVGLYIWYWQSFLPLQYGGA
jgi:hypothetical protein